MVKMHILPSSTGIRAMGYGALGFFIPPVASELLARADAKQMIYAGLAIGAAYACAKLSKTQRDWPKVRTGAEMAAWDTQAIVSGIKGFGTGLCLYSVFDTLYGGLDMFIGAGLAYTGELLTSLTPTNGGKSRGTIDDKISSG